MILMDITTLTAWDDQRTFYGHTPEDVSRKINIWIHDEKEAGRLNSYHTGAMHGPICDPATRDEWEYHAILYFNRNRR